MYNIACNQIDAECLTKAFLHYHRLQQHAYKINISCGYVLEEVTTGELTYYRPSQNNQLLVKHQTTLIKNERDCAQFVDQLHTIDIHECLSRPNTKYRLRLITNVTFYLTICRGTPIGCGDNMPVFLQRRRGVSCLLTNKHTGQPYRDNLCFFRWFDYFYF